MKKMLMKIHNTNNIYENYNFDNFYNTYKKQIMQVIVSVLKNDDRAYEILNDCFLYVWNNALFLAKLSKPISYLKTIAYNKSIDILRKQREVLLSDNYETPTNEDVILKTSIDNILSKLESEQRTSLILKSIYNYTFNDISKVLNCSYKKARHIYLEAEENFKKLWEE